MRWKRFDPAAGSSFTHGHEARQLGPVPPVRICQWANGKLLSKGNLGDLVWFDPGVGYAIPGEVVEYHRAGQVVTVQASISGKVQNFTMNNLASLKRRHDLGPSGVEDMIQLGDLNEASLLWNLRTRYDEQLIYTYTGSILVAVNPYKMFDIYGIDMVKKYEGQILGTLPPHLFAIGSSAYSRMSKDNENQVVVISGESGAGKTESTKLIMQYLAAVNKSPSNLITEQILEASPLLEAFGNAKTVRNDNSSRFGKYLEVHFKDGIITGAKTTEYLLEKSRIVTQAPEERNYHVFYEILAGLNNEEKDKYGLLTADKYFYLNQGGNGEIQCKDDAEDFQALLSAMQVLGFSSDEQDTIFKILASVLHLGNVYFHRKQLKHGQEGVEIGSDAEIKWTSHLLQLSMDGIIQALTTKTTEARNERLLTPLNIDQALDARDAIAKALYSSLFSWLVQRINNIICKGSKRTSIAILDIFGFEDFKENSFEQLCINYANETLQFYFNKHIFKLEQAEYAKEKIEWQTINFQDNQPVINLISKKPVGILHLLDDESNFPKATDLSFLEKCHYNHALNDLYSRPRMSSMEFGIKHYAGQVWYSVEGFLDKNRDTLRSDVIELLISSKVTLISKMFVDLRSNSEAAKTVNRSNGRFVTMKPRTPTVAARFHDSLLALLETMSKCNPWFVRCIKPNNEKAPMKFDMPIVLEQLRYTGMLETIKIRKMGYPIRLKFHQFADRYRCLVPGKIPKGVPAREICRVILDRVSKSRDQYQLGSSKVFLRETMEQQLEQERVDILRSAAVTIQKYMRGRVARRRFLTMKRNATKIQAHVRGYLARKRYKKVRRGIVRAQATYRMTKQKRRYLEMKEEMKRRTQAEKVARDRAKIKAQKEEMERVSRAAAGVNHLEIPPELAFIFSKLDDWQSPHGDRNLIKVVGNVTTAEERFRLPSDIDYYAFTKFTNVYFKNHIWGMKRDPIKSPFLAKLKDSDHTESVSIFKLILRFMNDNNLTGKRETALGNFIVQKGLMNENMRDEILCQLCNQTWKNENEASNERAWLLMANCLSCFPPSKTLYKYLLKYVSDHAYDGYKGICQKKLLQSERIDPWLARLYPPCLLEWKANKKKINMALSAMFPDGEMTSASVESWTAGEQFAAPLVKERGISECWGWTVGLQEDGVTHKMNGYDYVLDLISEMELPPAFPTCKMSSKAPPDRSKGQQAVEKKKILSSNNAEFMRPLKIDVDDSQAQPPSRLRFRSRSHEMILEDNHSNLLESKAKSRSRDRLMQDDYDTALSRSSMLNERYFDKPGDDVGRTASLDRLGLSQSRLNERYRSVENLTEQRVVNQNYFIQADLNRREHQQQKLTNGSDNLDSWGNYGLASSALNDRYFQQSEIEKQMKNRSRGGESLINASAHNQDQFSDDELQMNGHNLDRESNTSPELRRSPLSNGLVEFQEFDFQDLNGDRDMDQEGSKYGRVSNRFVKSKKLPQTATHNHSTKGYLETRYVDKDYAPRSSALSDTSEAPSLASHVRRVRVPSHTSDLDQYLDDLFNPVLDGNLDELSDARSLAASIKGGSGKNIQKSMRTKYHYSSRSSVFGDETRSPHHHESILTSKVDEYISEILESVPVHFSLIGLENADNLSYSIKGGGKGLGGMEPQGGTATQSVPFNLPLGGLNSPPMSGMMSPPPVMGANLGTPLGATSVPGMLGGMPVLPQVNSTLPLYTLGGFNLPLWNPTVMDPTQLALQQQLLQQQAMQMNSSQVVQMQQRAFLASAVQQNLQIQQQLMHQSQALQQLLQQSGAMGQVPAMQSVPLLPQGSMNFNMTSQTEALSTSNLKPTSAAQAANRQRFNEDELRNQKVAFREPPEYLLWSEDKRRYNISPPPPLPPKSESTPTAILRKHSPPPKGRVSPTFNMKSPQMKSPNSSPQAAFGDVVTELKSRRSSADSSSMMMSPTGINKMKFTNGHIPPPPPLPPNPPEGNKPFVNVYGRAKTVRIGKWRWPPPRSDGDEPDNFNEFKIRQIQKRHDDNGRGDRLSASSDEKSDMFSPIRERKESHSKSDSPVSEYSRDATPGKLDKSVVRAFEVGDQRPPPGSIGKLRISSEMRAKLEAVTMNHSVRSTSNKNDARRVYAAVNKLKAQAREDVNSHAVRKLEENRKLMLQQQLAGIYDHNGFGDDRNDDDGMEKSAFSRISAPPPPPVAPPSFNIPPPPPSILGGGSSYYEPGPSSLVPEPKSPPPPISPSGRHYKEQQHQRMERRVERITHEQMTNKYNERVRRTERITMEEGNDFMRQMEEDPSIIKDMTDGQLDTMKTKLYPTNVTPYNTYTRTSWTLHVRKEVFSPSEQLSNPLALHIVFCQVVHDAFEAASIRLNKEERKKLRQMIDGYGITPSNLHSSHHKITIKKNVIDLARDFPNYFARLYQVSGGRNLPDVHMIGINHTGVRLLHKERDAAMDWLRVLDEYSFEDIAEASVPRGSTLQLLLRTGHRLILFTHRATQIKNLIEQFALESDSGAQEYVRAVADYLTRESTLLSFRQGDIIRVVNKNQYLDNGKFFS